MSALNLLNFNGVNGTQVFTDDGLAPSSWTVKYGNPTLNTTTKLFGLSSLFLDGSSSINAPITSLSDTFTIECFFNLTDSIISNGGYKTIFQFNGSANQAGVIVYGLTANEPILGYSEITRQFSDYEVLQPNVWNHCALVVDKLKVFVFLNGRILVDSYLTDVSGNFNEIIIGSNTNDANHINAYIDCFRITDGEILYEAGSDSSSIPSSELNTTTTPLNSLDSDNHSDATNQKIEYQTNMVPKYTGGVILGGTNDGGTVVTNPTSTNIISGNVTKLGLPYGTRVVVVSVGVNPEVLGSGDSDPSTGDYSIDVYPYTEECLIYLAPDYGNDFVPDGFVGTGTIIHPTIPNKNVYIALNDGNVASSEPSWPEQGIVNSGTVSFNTLPLHRPLMNGFIKPVVTPI